MRRVILISLVSSIGLGAASLARAGDELVMPFECGLENGHLRLRPAPEKRYPIIGARDEQAVTTCHSSRLSGCRTIMAHRFVISCGGAGVDWMRVAAAMQHDHAAPAWIEDGQLNVMLPARGTDAALRACSGRPAFALAGVLQHRVAVAKECTSADGQPVFDQVVLPAGFAPVGEMGARLVLNTASTLHSEDARVRQVSSLRGETLVAKVEADDIVAPIPGLEPYDAEFDPAYAGDPWVTTVRAEADVSLNDASGPAPVWAWTFAAMALVTLLGLMRVRYADAWSGRFFLLAQRGNGLLNAWFSGSDGHASNTATAVTALLEQTETIVSRLKGAGPLREVLHSELKLVRQRIASVEAVAGEGEGAEVRAGTLYRALMRDLERIRRIADSAAASLSHARRDAGLPRTASEAYEVLGVNPDVSAGVLKKIVDGLRMTWHPDHARDEEDRRLREDRIRQINVAWELISANRAAA